MLESVYLLKFYQNQIKHCNSGLSMNILRGGDKLPMQEHFFKNSTCDLLTALKFLGRLYDFCNFVIILSLM